MPQGRGAARKKRTTKPRARAHWRRQPYKMGTQPGDFGGGLTGSGDNDSSGKHGRSAA